MNTTKRSLLVLLLLTVVGLPVLAQTTGSIRGTVTDPSGETVQDASVTVLNVETGFTRTLASNATGSYAFSNLPVGTYLLTVEVEGFKTVLVQNIVLNVADSREVNAQLELGQLSEQMTVTSSSIVVETIGGEVAGLITGEQVRELPLNGRNFLQLTQLMPGVSAPEGFDYKNKGPASGSDMSVSGGGVTSNVFTVDGASNNDSGSNRTILIYPSVDAIEEFKIHRNSYGAEFGGAGGAQINLVTRGGANDLDGSVFYFRRDDAWNTANLVLRRADQGKEPIERDDFGYTLGGAIKKDKLHFFVSQEWNDEVKGAALSARVPTAAEKRGDFSQTDTACSQFPVDPLTGERFPNDQIPADRLNDAGILFMSLYPDANISTPGNCTNWAAGIGVPIEWNQINARSDWTVNQSTRAMIRYTEDSWDAPGPTVGANGLWGDDAFPAADSAWEQPSESLVLQLNNVIGSSAINTVTFSMSGNEIRMQQTGDLALYEQVNNAIASFFPDSGKTAATRSHPVFWGGGGYPTLWSIAPWQNDLDITVLKDDYEQVFGDHVVKAGILYSESSKLEVAAGAFEEAPHFWGSDPGSGTGLGGWGSNTGNTVADFLLKDMFFGFDERSFNPIPDIQTEDLELYVADSWKIRPNMTLDYGVRYSRFKEPYNSDSSIYTMFNPATFDPALGNAPCNGIVYVPGNDPCGEAGFAGGTPGPNKSLINGDTNNFAPRLGFAWDLNGDGESVVRVGFGQFFQRERTGPFFGMLGNPGAGVQFTGGIRNVEGTDIRPDFVAAGLPSAGFDPNAETPYMLQYNATWERRLGRDSTIEVGYVASRGRHLLRSNEINQVPVGDPNGNGIPDRLEHARCPGGDGGAGCRASFRPFGVFGDRDIAWWTTNGKSDYDSIQAQYTLRYGRGSQIQTSYTLSDFKADQDVGNSSGGIGAESTTDLSNPSLDYAQASLDREHVFNASMIHNLPTYEGQGGFKEHFLGNWSVGGIVIYSSGTPLTITAADPGGPLSGETPAGTGFDPNFRPIRTSASCSGGSGTQFLNPDAFTLNGYRLGETSQMASRGACTGPDYLQIDMSLYKQIPLKNDAVNVQLRIEAFNIFNTSNYTGIDTNWGGGDVTLDAPLESATTITGSSPTSTFGTAFGARDPRQFQLGLKVSF